MNFRTLAIATTLSIATAAVAQTPPAAAPATSVVAKHTCAQPAMPGSSKTTTDIQMKRFVDELNKYKACLQAYAGEQQKFAEAAVASGNAAIMEYNTFVEAANKATNSGNTK